MLQPRQCFHLHAAHVMLVLHRCNPAPIICFPAPLHAPRDNSIAHCWPQARTAPTCGGSDGAMPRVARCCWNTWGRTRQWSSWRKAARRGCCRACGTTSCRGTSGRRRPSGDRTGSAALRRACPSWCAARFRVLDVSTGDLVRGSCVLEHSAGCAPSRRTEHARLRQSVGNGTCNFRHQRGLWHGYILSLPHCAKTCPSSLRAAPLIEPRAAPVLDLCPHVRRPHVYRLRL